jgi:hypothetical protein
MIKAITFQLADESLRGRLNARVEMPWYRYSRSVFSGLRPSIVTTLCSAVTEICSEAKPATASEIW